MRIEPHTGNYELYMWGYVVAPVMKVAYVLSQSKGGLPHYAAELANAVSRHADVKIGRAHV